MNKLFSKIKLLGVTLKLVMTVTIYLSQYLSESDQRT